MAGRNSRSKAISKKKCRSVGMADGTEHLTHLLAGIPTRHRKVVRFLAAEHARVNATPATVFGGR